MFQKFPMLRESESISQVSLHQIRLHQITSLQQNLEHNHAWKKITTSPSPTHIWGCFLLYSYYSETGLTLTSKNTCQANTWEPPSMGWGCNCIQRRCTSSSLPSPIPLLGGISWENPSCTGAYSIEHDLESRHLTCPSVLGTSFCQPSPYLFNPPPCYFNPPRPYFFQPSCLNMSIYEVLVLEEPWTGIDKNGTYSLLLPAHTLQLLSSAEIDLPDPQPYQLPGRPRKIDKLDKLEEGCRWGFVAGTDTPLAVPVVL